MKYLIILSLMVVSMLKLQAQAVNPKLDAYLLKKMKRAERIGLQAAYLADGELKWVGSYGLKTNQREDMINDSTLFMVASISKPVTALAIMKLYDEGKLSLDDDINEYLPFQIGNPNYPAEKITFRMLLVHVSSIRDNWKVLEPLYTLGKGGGDSPIGLGQFLKGYLTEGGDYYDSTKIFIMHRC